MLPERVIRLCDDLLETSRDDDNARGVSWNLKHEHRISDERGNHWAELMAGPLNRSLEAALRAYGDLAAETPFETYLHRWLNRANIPHPADADVPEPGDMLAHVLDLTSRRSMDIWRLGKDKDVSDLLRDRCDVRSADTLAPFLARHLSDKSTGAQLPIMRAFFSAYRLYVEERRPHGPVWAALWEKWFERINRLRAESWGCAMGLCKPQPPHWLVILKYPVDLAGTLVRPTQLEAGYFGRHFPTPPCAGTGNGGRIVHGRNGQSNTNPTKALREFVHLPMRWTEHEWIASRLPVIETAVVVGGVNQLRLDREGHWTDLCYEYGPNQVSSWMNPANG